MTDSPASNRDIVDMTDQAKSELLEIGRLLIRCIQQRPDNFKRVLADQTPAAVRLKAECDPLSWEGKWAALLLDACQVAHPPPALTVWDLPPVVQKPPLQELLELDPVTMEPEFSVFQKLLRAATDEDAPVSAIRRLVGYRRQIEELKRINSGCPSGEIYGKALYLIANISRSF